MKKIVIASVVALALSRGVAMAAPPDLVSSDPGAGTGPWDTIVKEVHYVLCQSFAFFPGGYLFCPVD